MLSKLKNSLSIIHRPTNLIWRIPIAFCLIWFAFCLPEPLFKDPTSTIVTDENNELLAARIASDGQWRFPDMDSVPYKFEQSIVYFEDQYFRYHPGINPVSLIKAFITNIKSGEVKRGGDRHPLFIPNKQ